MRKWVLIFAIAVIMAGVSGQPGKGTPKNHAAPPARPQTDSQNSNQDGTKTPTMVVQIGTQQTDTAETQEKKENDRNLARYTLLLAIFTAVLAIVSIAQGYFLHVHGIELKALASAARDNATAAKTLSETASAQMLVMQGQLAQTEQQTKILSDSVAAAQKAADAALAQVEAAKSAQRAQLRIEFDDLNVAFNEELGGYPIRFAVILDGTTRAYILEDNIVADIPGYPMEDRRYFVGLGLNRNFTPEMSPFVGYTILQTNEFPPGMETDEAKIRLVQEGALSVRVQGRILYRDIFGDKWRLDVHRAWSHLTRTWGLAGKDGDDGHRQVERWNANRAT